MASSERLLAIARVGLPTSPGVAGVNAKTLSTYCGHANISITLDRYGHLFPSNEDEAAALLDAFLARASEQSARASLAPAVS